MDIAQHTDQPARVEIAGVAYGFSELPIEALGRLQQWIKDHHPNPMEVIKPHLDGFAAADRAEIIRQARQEAASWPPQVGTGRGAQALLGDEAGQREAFYEGLRVHQPNTTRKQADRLFRELGREAARAKAGGAPDVVAERSIARIFGILFGADDDPLDGEGEGDGGPKARGAGGDAALIAVAAAPSPNGSIGT